MKNWLPLVPGPLLAIATTPRAYVAAPWASAWGRFSSANTYVGPPAPVPDGSPHWSTKMPPLTMRWHLLPSKNFWPARWAKLAAVHGVLAVSMVISTGRLLMVTVITAVPERGSPEVGGVPTALRLGFPVSAGVHRQAPSPPGPVGAVVGGAAAGAVVAPAPAPAADEEPPEDRARDARPQVPSAATTSTVTAPMIAGWYERSAG